MLQIKLENYLNLRFLKYLLYVEFIQNINI